MGFFIIGVNWVVSGEVGVRLKVFKYLTSERGLKEIYDIYKAVQDLDVYAKAIYKGNWEDALDEAFFHLMDNYDSSKGELDHYAIKVVGKILFNKNKREVSVSDYELLLFSNNKEVSCQDSVISNMDSSTYSNNFEECLQDMVEYFIKDFKFFVGGNPKDKLMNYNILTGKYTASVIADARAYLIKTYLKPYKEFLKKYKICGVHKVDFTKYTRSFDQGLVLVSEINDIFMVKKNMNGRSKILYRLDLKEVVRKIVKIIYQDSKAGVFDIASCEVYMSLSGKITTSMEELKSLIEKELIFNILAQNPFKILKYDEGVNIIFTSNRDVHPSLFFTLFDYMLVFDLEKLTVKEV